MSDKGAERPIIVVRKKVNVAAHHGGAWKVAYADFVTAMMAFFLVMWLVASMNQQQRAAMFDYFKNPSMQEGSAPKPAPGQQGPGGASTSSINLQGGMDAPQTMGEKPGRGETPLEQRPSTPIVEDAKKIQEAEERRQLESLMKELEAAIEKSQTLKAFKDQLLIDITPEGLRIQIVDARSRAMFDRGSYRLKPYTVDILREVGKYLSTVPNRLSISGHTDSTPYSGNEVGFSNWELSAERANAARRTLIEGGLPAEKVARVVGLSSAVLFARDDPTNAVNRRISIIVMTKKAEEAALATDDPKNRLSSAHIGGTTAMPPQAQVTGAAAPPPVAVRPAIAAAVPPAPAVM